MKLSDLIARLEDLRDRFGDMPVLAAYQESYPLAGSIVSAVALEDGRPAMGERPAVAWIAVGGPPPSGWLYAPRAAFDAEGDRV